MQDYASSGMAHLLTLVEEGPDKIAAVVRQRLASDAAREPQAWSADALMPTLPSTTRSRLDEMLHSLVDTLHVPPSVVLKALADDAAAHLRHQ
jgi:hypothetical protein